MPLSTCSASRMSGEVGAEPKLTRMARARPFHRTLHHWLDAMIARGMRSLLTLGQCSDDPAGKKSPIATSTLPPGTRGVPSCLAAATGRRRSAMRIQATRCAPWKPGLTELDQPTGKVATIAAPSATSGTGPVAGGAAGGGCDVPSVSRAPTPPRIKATTPTPRSTRRRRIRRFASPISGSSQNGSRGAWSVIALLSLAPEPNVKSKRSNR
jgi:hypothetical protein